MKKLYILFFIIMITGFSYGQSVIITRVFDGTLVSDGCSGTSGSSTPKGVELYVSGTINFSGYKIQTESNGSATGESWISTDISALGTKTNQFVYCIDGGGATVTTFAEMYPTAIYVNGPSGNGNDAYRIVDAAFNVIDQYGNPSDISGSADYSAAWAYLDGYAKRNNGTTANAGAFNASNWTFSGSDALDPPNNTCAFFMSSISFGSYTLSTKENQIESFSIYPNPTNLGYVNLTSNSQTAMDVSVFDILGKQVIKETVTNNTLNVSKLNAGIYVIKVAQDNVSSTKKLVIK